MGQLGEEEVRREASSQPGEAAQDGEPREAGDGAPDRRRRGRTESVRVQEEEEQEDEENQEEEDEGRDGGEEEGEHGCRETEDKEEAARSPGFNQEGGDLGEAGGPERVYPLRRRTLVLSGRFHGDLTAAAACFHL